MLRTTSCLHARTHSLPFFHVPNSDWIGFLDFFFPGILPILEKLAVTKQKSSFGQEEVKEKRMAAPLNRQAAHLLSSSSSSSSSSSLGAEIAAESVLELRRSGVLQRLSKSEAPADATEVHRLLVRCDSLVGQDSRQGFVLARELLRALPWSHVSAHASKWVSSGIANLRYAPREIVGVLDILMGSASRDRPEYHRAVVAPNLASYAGAMLNVADSTQEPAVLVSLLSLLAALAERQY